MNKKSETWSIDARELIHLYLAHAILLATITGGTFAITWLYRHQDSILPFLGVLAAEIIIIGLTVFFSWRYFFRKRMLKDFKRRTEEHHKFAHHARDLMVRIRGPLKSTPREGDIVPEEYRELLKKMMFKVYMTFKLLVPHGANVMVTIRERRGNEYVTILREGDINSEQRSERELNTEALHRENKIVATLRRKFDEGDCVHITGAGLPDWQKLKNEDLDMDRSVLMSAVFSKEWNPKLAHPAFVPIELEWILCVCASEAEVFDENHKPLMKCFNDICGLILNMLLHHGSYKGPVSGEK